MFYLHNLSTYFTNYISKKTWHILLFFQKSNQVRWDKKIRQFQDISSRVKFKIFISTHPGLVSIEIIITSKKSPLFQLFSTKIQIEIFVLACILCIWSFYSHVVCSIFHYVALLCEIRVAAFWQVTLLFMPYPHVTWYEEWQILD